MKFKTLIYSFLLLFFIVFSLKINAQNKQLSVKNGILYLNGWNFEKDGNIDLSGEWQFYWNKFYSPKDFMDTTIKPDIFINVPGVWTGLKIKGKAIPDTGYATFRLTIISDTNYAEGIMIFFKEILTAYKVFFNGKLISQIGVVAKNSRHAIPQVRINKESILIHKGENELIVQVSNYNHRTNAFDKAPVIGEEDNIDRTILKSISLDFLLLGLLLIMAFYHLGLFFFRKQNKLALYFALFTLVIAARILVTNNFLLSYMFSVSWNTVYTIGYLTLYLGFPLFVLYFQQVFKEERFKWIFRAIYFISAIFILTLFLPSLIYTKLIIYYQIIVALYMIFMLVLHITYLFKHKQGAIILFVSIIILFFAVLNDMLYTNDIIHTMTLAPIGFFFLILGQSLALGKIFTTAFVENENLSQKLEYQNKNLEDIVSERTKELEQQKLNLSEKNEELLVAEEELRQNNEELILLSDNLENRNRELKNATIKLQSQAVIGDILRNTTFNSFNLHNFLQQTLEIVLQIPWLKLVAKGSIFVTDNDGNLEMVAQKDLGILTQKCAIIKPGQCLCGRALSQKKIIFRNSITPEHEIESDDMKPHGHYNIPLIINDKVVGVLNLYVSEKHQSNDFELEYLNTLGSIIASVINRYHLRRDLEKQKIVLAEQNSILESLNLDLKKYFAAMQQSNVAIVITDKDANIEYVNPHFTKVTKYTFEEVKGKNPKILNSGKTSTKIYDDLWEHLNNGQVWEGEFINKSKEGREFIEKAIISPIFDDSNEIINYLAIKEDITELRKSEQEIQDKNKKLEVLNTELQKVLKDILASINYAKRIQKALLPSRVISKYILNEYFLIYKPKETVSGDFYFIQEKSQYKIFGVGDCTGHGVPGGFLTMLSITFLKELINNFDETKPAKLLENLRQKMQAVLNVNETITNDGLDLAFCVFDTNKRKLYYSGANMPIFIVRNGKLIEYKAVRNPIGNYPLERKFVSHEIDIEKDDKLYISSDGYWDQFGTENAKYTIKRFKELLLKINKYSFAEQKNRVEKEHEQWKGKYLQIDDITVLGINFSKL